MFVNLKVLIDNIVWLYIVVGGLIFCGGKIYIICVVMINGIVFGKVSGVVCYIR